MEHQAQPEQVFAVSSDVVAREIEGELLIVPLAAGIGEVEDEFYTLNETGKAVWSKLDGKTRLDEIIRQLAEEFEAEEAVIRGDVAGLIEELLSRKMILPVS
jgi:hypothetical protein